MNASAEEEGQAIYVGDEVAQFNALHFGVFGAGALASVAVSMKPTKEEQKMKLPADPYLLTNAEPRKKASKPSSLIVQLLRLMWSTFKFFTGISLLERVVYSTIGCLGQIKLAIVPDLPEVLQGLAYHFSSIRYPVEPYDLASKLSLAISELATPTGGHSGVVEALSKEDIAALAKSPLAPLLAPHNAQFRPADQKTWADAYVSTSSFEEMLLSPQYASLLVKSKRDGAIYQIEGYFGLSHDLKLVPLELYYNKVAYSLSNLQAGLITSAWQAHLSSGWKRLGDGAEAMRDLSLEYRAVFMPKDLSRMMTDADWMSYTGSRFQETKCVRELSKSAGVDVWKIGGSSTPGSESNGKYIEARITNEPKKPLTEIEVLFPETEDSLENRTTLLSPVIMCSRWCAYAEHHLVLGRMLGKGVRLASSPRLQQSFLANSEFDGMVLNCEFQVVGSIGHATIHLKVARDTMNDGRCAYSPVVSVTAETEYGWMSLYENKRERFTFTKEIPIGDPIDAPVEDQPYLSSDFKVYLPNSEPAL